MPDLTWLSNYFPKNITPYIEQALFDLIKDKDNFIIVRFPWNNIRSMCFFNMLFTSWIYRQLNALYQTFQDCDMIYVTLEFDDRGKLYAHNIPCRSGENSNAPIYDQYTLMIELTKRGEEIFQAKQRLTPQFEL